MKYLSNIAIIFCFIVTLGMYSGVAVGSCSIGNTCHFKNTQATCNSGATCYGINSTLACDSGANCYNAGTGSTSCDASANKCKNISGKTLVEHCSWVSPEVIKCNVR